MNKQGLAKQAKYAAMASHDWQGADGENHRRVARVVHALARLGLLCWFDEEYMKGNVHETMIEGITESEGFLAFITRRYHDKVAGKDSRDNCQFEFRVALERKGVDNMLAIVLDEDMCNTRAWAGLMTSIAGNLFFNLTNIDNISGDPELDALLQSKLIPLMTWLTPDSYTKGAFLTFLLPAVAGSRKCKQGERLPDTPRSLK